MHEPGSCSGKFDELWKNVIIRKKWDNPENVMLQVLAILEEFYVNGDIDDAAATLQV